MNVHPKKGPKESINLTIDAELLDEARSKALDLSHLLEEKLREERVCRWQSENRAALEEHAAFIECHGTLTERLWITENEQAVREYNAMIEKFGIWPDRLRRG